MKLAKIIGIPLVGVLALLLIVELVMRFAMPVAMEPPVSITLNNKIPGFEDNVVDFYVDSDGIRGHQWGEERQAGSLRVLFVGPNSTNDFLQKAKNTWWGRLGQALEEKTGKRVEAGSIGGLTRKEIVYGVKFAEKALNNVEADIIVAQYGLHDVLAPVDYKLDTGILSKITVTPARSFKYKLAEMSQIFRRIRANRVKKGRDYSSYQQPNFVAQQMGRAMQLYQEAPFIASVDYANPEDPLQGYLIGVQGFIDLAKSKNVKLLIVGQPTLHHGFLGPAEKSVLHRLVKTGPGENDYSRVSPDWIQRQLETYYGNARQVCEKAGVPFVSLNGKIERVRDNFVSDGILTDAGAQKAADLLLPELEKIAAK